MRRQSTLGVISILIGFWSGPSNLHASVQGQDQKEGQQEGQEGVPAKRPRVVGQAQTKEEFDAWSVIEKLGTDTTEDFKEKAQLNLNFLQEYPDSGLTPLAHQFLALAYQQENNFEKFVEHGEKAVVELPTSYVLMIELAVGYAESGSADKAIAHGQRGLEVSAAGTKPVQLTTADFISKRDSLQADANYAIGLSRLHQSLSGGSNKDEFVEQARVHLEQAIELDPNHERAYLRLGRVCLTQQNAEQALDAFARAVAVGGQTQEIAQGQLEQLYTYIHKKTEGMDEAVAKGKEFLQQKSAEKAAKLKEIEDQEAQQLTQPGTTPAATESTEEPFTLPE